MNKSGKTLKEILKGKSLKELLPRSVLVPVAAAGVLLSLAAGGTAVYFTLARDGAVYPREQGSARFRQELQRYDAAAGQEGERALRQLERRAGTQLERLSVLKRWRVLAKKSPALLPGYEAAALRALKDFPYSENLAALAMEAVYMYGGNAAAQAAPLQDYADIEAHALALGPDRFAPLVLSYHALTGNLRDPETAARVPGIALLLSADLESAPAEVLADLAADGVLLRIAGGGSRSAPLEINSLISENPDNRGMIRLGAEYFYDYGEPLRSAELFSRLGDSESLFREADALALAGEIPAARNLLAALASPRLPDASLPDEALERETSLRLFYNLAATAESGGDAQYWLERLLSAGGGQGSSDAEIYGLIRYTRNYDTERSIAFLEGSGNPILELELLRRRMETWPVERWTPEIWLLLERYPENESLFRWGAAFFDRQKLYGESAQLLRIAENRQFAGGWFFFHRGLAMIREGRHEEGENFLTEAASRPGGEPWLVYANLGRLNESRRSIGAAVDNYARAAELVKNNADAVSIQLRLSRCYESLGRFRESAGALERARELDPDDVNVRHELGRIPLR